jgi:hypothetical protein
LDFRTFNIDPTGRPFFCYKTGILGESFLGNGGKKLWQSESFRAKRELVKTCDKICRLRCYYRDNFWDKILG